MEMSRADRLTTGLGIIFLIGILLIPPLCPVHTNPITSFWTEWLAGVLMLAGWGFLFLGNRERFPAPLAALPWLAWGLSLGLSTVTNHYALWSSPIFAGTFWVMGLLSLLFGAELAMRLGRERIITIVAYIMAVSGILQAVLGLLRYYAVLSRLSIYLRPLKESRLEGLFNYPTLTGFSLWLSLAALVYLFYKRRIGWVLLAVGSLIMTVPVVATGNRSSILYWLSLVSVSILVWVRGKKSTRQTSEVQAKRIFGGLAVITMVVVISFPSFRAFDRMMGAYMKSMGYPERSQSFDQRYHRKQGDFWGMRWAAFRKAIILAKKAPLFGIGPGNYSYNNFLLNDLPFSIREGTIDTHTHNIFSMLLAEEGGVGLIVLIIGCCLLAWWWWQMGASLEAAFSGIVLADFFIYSNIEYPLWYLNFLVIFMVFCGFVSPIKVEKLRMPTLKSVTAVVLLAVGGFLSWYVAYGYLEISSINLNEIASMKSARKLEKWFASPLWAAEAGLAFEQVTLASPQDIPDQLSLAQQVIERLPTPPALLHKIILLDFQNKQKEACALAYKTASSYPTVAGSFQRLLSGYTADPKGHTARLKRLQSCFNRGVESWKAQWEPGEASPHN